MYAKVVSVGKLSHNFLEVVEEFIGAHDSGAQFPVQDLKLCQIVLSCLKVNKLVFNGKYYKGCLNLLPSYF